PAEAPALLFSLATWLPAAPAAADRARPFGRPMGRGPWRFPPPGLRPPANAANAKRKRGLNENYAREIMELHTLGVDGGYTQRDVNEVARCFTGWTIRGLKEQKPTFEIDDPVHDHGPKVVLGQILKGGGQDEGKKVIHVLATHPSTARFLATKLAPRFGA